MQYHVENFEKKKKIAVPIVVCMPLNLLLHKSHCWFFFLSPIIFRLNLCILLSFLFLLFACDTFNEVSFFNYLWPFRQPVDGFRVSLSLLYKSGPSVPLIICWFFFWVFPHTPTFLTLLPSMQSLCGDVAFVSALDVSVSQTKPGLWWINFLIYFFTLHFLTDSSAFELLVQSKACMSGLSVSQRLAILPHITPLY